jgi:hypothetical protein
MVAKVILNPYRFNLAYAVDLVSDVDGDKMYVTPSAGLENHPGFTLGHLVSGSALVAKYLGEECAMPDGWVELFQRNGPGDPTLPTNDAPNLPFKSELLDELKQKHELVERLVVACDAARFSAPCDWRFGRYFPTVGDMLTFMCVTHEAMHLAQVAAWRRGMGYASSLGRL